MADDATIEMWVHERPGVEVRRTLEHLRRAPGVVHVAVMPDVHLAAGVSNGVAVRTRRYLYSAAVGGDIGCGFAAVAFDGAADRVARRPAADAILKNLCDRLPIIRHRRRDGVPDLQGAIDSARLSAPELAAKATTDGRLELGTLGRGNHFLELQRDDDGRLWVMVHSGSRAMGQYITMFHLKNAGPATGGLSWLDSEDETGQAYLRDVEWARAYSAQNRARMLKAASQIVAEVTGLEADWSTLRNTDHNHVVRDSDEEHDFWVHRKGANEAQKGIGNMIPGSMATHTYHVIGRGSGVALNSSSHGAGRRLSRGAARRRIRREDLEKQIAHIWVDPRIAGRLADESPGAYKDIDEVMRAQRDLVKIARRLTPILCHKGT